MRKTFIFLTTLCVLLMVGCNPYPPMSERNDTKYTTEEDVVEEQSLVLMVDDKLYCSNGKLSDQKERCGIVDGVVETTVQENQIPTKNNESNFGVGYQYQTGAEIGTIDVFVDGEWWIFEEK